jgi:hypothetical protein
MDRRGFVTAFAVAVSGCLGDDGRNRTANRTGDATENRSNDGADDGGMTRQEAVGGLLRGSFVRLEAGWTVSAFPHGYNVDGYDGLYIYHGFVETEGADEPPRIRVIAENDTGSEVTVDTEAIVPYGVGSATHDGTTVYIVPAETPGIQPRNGVWRVENLPEPQDGELTVDAGGFAVREYVPVLKPDGELREGVYRFGDEDELAVSVWETGSPEPQEASIFEGETYPDIENDTRWYHEADETTRLYLQPSDERLEPPATAEFTLVNRTEERVYPGGAVYKLVDGRWIHENPFHGTGSEPPVEPGGVENTRFELHPVDEPREHNAPPLGGGTYCTGKDDFAAVFEVDASALELRPPEEASVERRDGSVFVDVGLDAEVDAVVEKVDRYGEEAERVIAQNVYWMEVYEDRDTDGRRYDLLNYSVPFVDGTTERVVVRNAVSGSFDPKLYVYDGEAYSLSAREG